ncbi:MAG TPA: transporter [Candidatus Sulfotelmatobacter sp.]|nr:transporter [Candidatus Sulfotelmatobacter sp.]
MNMLFQTAKTLILMAAIALLPICTLADESGAGYWLVGAAGSLAAAKATPGCTFASTFYFADENSTSTVTLPNGQTAKVNVNVKSPFYLPSVSCTPFTKILGGQFTASFAWPVVHASVDATATLTGTTTGASKTDSNTGMGDMYPNVNLRWNRGVNNYLVYVQPGAPFFSYDTSRLANLGAGHMSMDQGFAYTYLNVKTRWEASFQTGFTYNWENSQTHYQNGVDMHTDWGTSKFLHYGKSHRIWQIGAVGYYYQQLTGDSGSGNKVGSNISRVVSLGPQFGMIHKLNSSWEGYINVKAYGEFAAQNRSQGYVIFVTWALSHKAQARTAGVE